MSCEILSEIYVSHRLVKISSEFSIVKETETAKVFVVIDPNGPFVFCLTPMEYHHMRSEVQSLLLSGPNTVPAQYYTAKYIFGHYLTPE